MSHVFISYVRDDAELVNRLARDLSAYPIDLWLDREKIRPGEHWQDAIRHAIREGNHFIACFSSGYASRDKTYMNEELTLAIEQLRQYSQDRIWFIPVLLSKCEVPNRNIGSGQTLRDLQWVELYNNWDDGIKRIATVIVPEATQERDFSAYMPDIKEKEHAAADVQPAFIYGQRVLAVFPTFIALISQLLDATDQLLAHKRDRLWDRCYHEFVEYYYRVMEQFLTDMPDLHRKAKNAIELITHEVPLDRANMRDTIHNLYMLSDTIHNLSTAYKRVTQSRDSAIRHSDGRDDLQNKILYGSVVHLQGVCNSIVSRAGEYLDTLITISFNRRQ